MEVFYNSTFCDAASELRIFVFNRLLSLLFFIVLFVSLILVIDLVSLCLYYWLVEMNLAVWFIILRGRRVSDSRSGYNCRVYSPIHHFLYLPFRSATFYPSRLRLTRPLSHGLSSTYRSTLFFQALFPSSLDHVPRFVFMRGHERRPRIAFKSSSVGWTRKRDRAGNCDFG